MELTNILVMDLPEGAVRMLEAPCEVERVRVPLSFDQRKHAASGDRPGSWMAVVFECSSPDDLRHLPQAWDEIVRRHGTLRTAIVEEAGGLSLAMCRIGESQWGDVPATSDDVRETVRQTLDATCRPLGSPSYRLLVVEPEVAGANPRIIIGADHAHVDAWSLLVLVRDLSQALQRRSGHEAGTSSPDLPAPPFAAHTTELLCRPPTPAPVLRRWAEILDAEGGTMPTFPLPLGDISEPRAEVIESHAILDAAGLQGLERWCATNRVRMISAAVLALTSVSQSLAQRPLRAVLPVHSRFEPRWADSVGWFITNSVLECHEANPRSCADAVSSAIALGSHPLEPIMRPYGAMPEGPGMFALSWLDYRRLPIVVPEHSHPQHVSAVIRTDGVMAWFVVTDEGLKVRVRYPDTPQARTNLRAWVDAVIAHVRALADAPLEASSS